MKIRRYWSLLLATAFWTQSVVLANSSGPSNGYTGAPGEGTCMQCHAFGAGNGELVILGVPNNYEPGATYTVTVRLEDPGQRRWGFEHTVIDENGHSAGNCTVTDPLNTQITDPPPPSRDYMKQTLTGTYVNIPDGPVTWQFDWTAPPTVAGPISFFTAGIAANADYSTGGDYVYSTSFMSHPPASPTATPTAEPSVTPSATPFFSPSPTPTPEPCTETGVFLTMPAYSYITGDPCYLIATICNLETYPMEDEKLFVILEAYGMYYFAPAWGTELEWYGDDIDFHIGPTLITVLERFDWPVDSGSGAAVFWGALTDPAVTEILAAFDTWEFTWE
ncbi:hypothetical protein JW905_00230 [bacterium]|nr:hypothetical protein [candidate division CSSED10-310 bacterium]